jgi:predicted Zn-dependent protease
MYAVRAGDFLHPDFAPGLPLFVAGFSAPPRIRALPPAQRVQALARAAARGGAHAKLLYGVALQQLGRPVSARREFSLAVKQAPRDVEALVADAVGRFDKDRPARAFSRLGPLSRRFPRAATVRFHLGYLLLSIGQVREGKRQLRLAVAEQPSSLQAREAKALLARLVKQ